MSRALPFFKLSLYWGDTTNPLMLEAHTGTYSTNKGEITKRFLRWPVRKMYGIGGEVSFFGLMLCKQCRQESRKEPSDVQS